jgi:hypothetical protein
MLQVKHWPYSNVLLDEVEKAHRLMLMNIASLAVCHFSQSQSAGEAPAVQHCAAG